MGDDDVRRTALSPRLGALPRFKLANGLEVLVVTRATAPVAEIIVKLARGDVHMSPVGLGNLAVGLSRSTCDGDTYLFDVGGSQQGLYRYLGRRYTAEVFSGNLANGLVAVGDEVRCRELGPESVKRLRYGLEAREEVRAADAKDVHFHAAERFWKALYPDQAFGMTMRDQDALRQTTESDLEAALRAQFRPDGALALVVTDRPLSEFRPRLEQVFGSWERSSAPAPRPGRVAGPPPASRTVAVLPRSDAAQASLRLGCRLPAATGDTVAVYDLFEALIRRETDEVRMSWGASYGLYVQVLSYPNGVAHLRVSGGVEHSRVVDAVNRLLTYLRQLADSGPDFKAFLLERWDLAAEFNRRFATGSGIAESVLFAHDRGWPLDMWDRYPEALASVRRNNIKELAAACAGREAVTVVGRADVVGQLSALGLAPATVQVGK
jgi:predicted Zn-dependent peptidase